MSIKSKADWLRGFLESLEYGDNISQRQIKVLKEKLNELLNEVNAFRWEEDDEDEDEDEDGVKDNNKTVKNNIISTSPEDDLPF